MTAVQRRGAARADGAGARLVLDLLPEYPPHRIHVVLTLVATVALVIAGLVVQVPQVAQVTLVGVRSDALRVAGASVPELVDGARVTLEIGSAQLAGTASAFEEIPDSSATAFVFTPDTELTDVPEQYSTARGDFGRVSVARALVGAW